MSKHRFGAGVRIGRLGLALLVATLMALPGLAARTQTALAACPGAALAWGDNSAAQLGDGTTLSRTSPVLVSNLSGVTRVVGGAFHSLAVKSDGTVWAWGQNNYGQLGDGTTTDRITPVRSPA